jgi:hypothetical protein
MMVSGSRDADGIGVVQGDGGVGVPLRATGSTDEASERQGITVSVNACG